MAEISEKRGLLIVSLPKNEIKLAKAAKDAGAEILEVHVNMLHPAAGTRFRSLNQERGALEAILATGLPVGIVIGEEETISRRELQEIKQLGFCYISASINMLRPYHFEVGLPVIPALYPAFPSEMLPYLRTLPGEWLVADILPLEAHGKEMRAEDLVRLSMVGQMTDRRLVIPTQRKLQPDDLTYLFQLPYANAIRLSTVVTGNGSEGIFRATSDFREKLDAIL
ncbi:MAG: hypothetical protein HYR55_16245 [Acidobacteria bacterium]|nr:hypothetical protein [Acidobacteriota bacterium]MBI3655476.1 hypothetical protein [Acidobacteriota bacterium]